MSSSGASTISLHFGHTGINIGLSQWQLLNAERLAESEDQLSNDSYFYERQSGKYQPRALLADTDPSCFDSILTKNDLFSFDQFLSNNKGPAVVVKEIHDNERELVRSHLMNSLRQEVEKCDRVSQINQTLDLSGGTGTLLMRRSGQDISFAQFLRVQKCLFA